jgi:PPK2 family polyphosphate:nucleotide phosphotransferase
MRLRRVSSRHLPRLTDAEARPAVAPPPDSVLKPAIRQLADQIGELQSKLYADGRVALLIVLQGRDASGKDSTIRKVFAQVDPQGCEVTSFKVPTPLEARHDFLWRVHARVPARGMIGIFNRSHYEDVLVPYARREMSLRAAEERLAQVNDFERMLTGNGVVILKFMLHISRGAQRRQLQERLTDPTKNWKFNAGDLVDRANWGAYTKAYRLVVARTSTESAPWYVVPSDDRDMRNWFIAETVADRLDEMGLRYPRASREVLRMRIR